MNFTEKLIESIKDKGIKRNKPIKIVKVPNHANIIKTILKYFIVVINSENINLTKININPEKIVIKPH